MQLYQISNSEIIPVMRLQNHGINTPRKRRVLDVAKGAEALVNEVLVLLREVFS